MIFTLYDLLDLKKLNLSLHKPQSEIEMNALWRWNTLSIIQSTHLIWYIIFQWIYSAKYADVLFIMIAIITIHPLVKWLEYLTSRTELRIFTPTPPAPPQHISIGHSVIDLLMKIETHSKESYSWWVVIVKSTIMVFNDTCTITYP